MTVRTRFAPSPTGYMHVGGLRTALYAYLLARKSGGAFVLRIEDTDQARFVEGAQEVIVKTLLDCGLKFDEGPFVQSERRDIYREHAEKLVELGGAYRDGEVIRQRIPKDGETAFDDVIHGHITFQNRDLDEGVLIKSDGMPTYNFAHVIDDRLMGITHVLRGKEFVVSTPKHILIYKSFGWEVPTYIHVAPVMRDAANKFSKRSGDPTYEDLLARGFLKEAVLNYVALLGWSPGGEREKFSLAEMAEIFDLSRLSKSPAIFDIEKLKWLNGEYLKAMSDADFQKLSGIENPLIAKLLKPRIATLAEIPEQTDFFEKLPDYDAELFVHKKMKTDRELAKKVLEATLAKDGDFEGVIAELGLKNGQVLYPVRIALSGKAVTPGGAHEIFEILGKEESLRRIRIGIEKL